MAHSHKKYLTSRNTCKFMKKYANRKIRQISVYEELPNHKYFRRISNPYDISDGYWNGWSEDYISNQPLIYTFDRTINNVKYNDNIWFRYFRNK